MKCGFGRHSQTSQEGPRKVGESARAGTSGHVLVQTLNLYYQEYRYIYNIEDNTE